MEALFFRAALAGARISARLGSGSGKRGRMGAALALDLTAQRLSPQVILWNSSNKFGGSICAPGERWRPLRSQTHRSVASRSPWKEQLP